MCGVFGVQGSLDATKYTFLGLYALQHRGEESAGIVTFNREKANIVKGCGLVEEVFKKVNLDEIQGSLAMGHVRYSTTGSSNDINVQPFMVKHRGKTLAVVHNGNLTNTSFLSQQLESSGSIFQTSMDSEILIHLLAKSSEDDLENKFVEALGHVEGAYSALFMVDDILVGARDPYGVRPLSLGKKDGAYFFTSETCAFDLVGVEYIRDIARGEIVFIYPDGKIASKQMKKAKASRCVFEQVYFARPDSLVFGQSISKQRKRLGHVLAEESFVDADMVLAVPDSGNFAAMGYAEKSGIPFEMGIVRNHYIGRTFIKSSQLIREFSVKIKLNPIRDLVDGKKIVLVDDSIVRGTTSKRRVEALRECGAKEIHMRVSCPPVVSPCFYGMDFPSTKDLIGAQKSVEAIGDHIGVDSLSYLSLQGMKNALNGEKDEFCDACFSKSYPIKVDQSANKYVMENA
ncbi:amidophosphoribosyltransferase [PVC group bacterium (ex Bugula neritina AB1)]|nr:amidophosphoribosyltransferase [PVC group bacterium (ex Bugula neritina AB1)]